MNKYIKIKRTKPAVLYACMVLGIILLIYAFIATIYTEGGDNSAIGSASAELESEPSAEEHNSANDEEELGAMFPRESEEEKQSRLLAQEKDSFYMASRGGDTRPAAPAQAATAAQETPAVNAEEKGPVQHTQSAPGAEKAPTTAAQSKPAATAAQNASDVVEKSAAAAAPKESAAAPEKSAAAPPSASTQSVAPPSAPTQPAAAPAVPSTDKPVPVSPAESSDLDLLARLITAEAQGEPFEAQVAVGAVVMNRVKSSDWPNSIKSVIYQKIGEYYQFTPVVNGWIDKPAQPEAIEAAKAAMNGSDPSRGAQFYYDDKCTNEWILAKPVSVRIGHMIFAY